MALQVGKIFATAKAKTGGFTSGMQALGASVLSFKKTALMAFGAVGAAVGGFIGSSIKSYSNYSDVLKKAAVVTKQTGDEAMTLEEREKSLDETFKQLGKDTRFTMGEIAAAGTEIGRTGYNVEETKDALWGVVDVAAASGEDLPMVAKKLTNVAKGFGMEADELGRLGDVFAEASRSHNVTVQSLSEAFEYFGPIANQMDWSIEKATAMMGILGDLGIASGQAGRQFKSVMADWSKMKAGQELPAKSANVMRKVADSIGMNFSEMVGQIESGELEFMEFLQMIGKSDNVVGDLAQLFTKLASAPLAALSGSGVAVKEATEHLEGSKGSAKEMAEAMRDTLAGQIDILRGSFAKLKVDIGEKFGPAIQGFIENTLVPLVNTLGEWVEKTETIGDLWESLGDLIGEENMEAIKTVTEGLVKMIKTLGKVYGPTLQKSFEVLGQLIQAVASMMRGDWAQAGNDLKKAMEKYAEAWTTLISEIMEHTKLDQLVETIANLIDGIKRLLSKLPFVNLTGDKKGKPEEEVTVSTRRQETLSKVQESWQGMLDSQMRLGRAVRQFPAMLTDFQKQLDYSLIPKQTLLQAEGADIYKLLTGETGVKPVEKTENNRFDVQIMDGADVSVKNPQMIETLTREIQKRFEQYLRSKGKL